MRSGGRAGAVGIDFGTSNCAAAVADAGIPRLLPLDGDQVLLPSVLYARERSVLVRETPMSPKGIDDARSLAALLRGSGRLEVGSAAVSARIEAPLEGVYFKSPKRFLASDLRSEQRALFQHVVATMLAHIRDRSEASAGRPLQQVVLGRPVTYSNTADPEADGLAIATMQAAAKQAGFSHIEFLMEPIAAALEYERSLTEECVALVFDAGGGTTDCTVVRLGPRRARRVDRAADVLSTAGCRSGGVDIDQSLAWDRFMPLFGRDQQGADGRPLPYTPFHQAIQVHDIPEQARFYASEPFLLDLQDRVMDRQPLEYLLRVLRGRLTDRLVRSAELTKIALTDSELVTVPLAYVDEALQSSATRADLRELAGRIVQRMTEAAREAIRMAGVMPQSIFITGGTARSPVVAALVQAGLDTRAPIVTGDLFGSVASGLALQARKVFGSK